MWLSLFAVVMILAVTFYQGLQGLFSAAITCILTVLSAALALGLYEDVYFGFLVTRQPDHGRAIALMVIFVVGLLLLRLVFDQIIQGNMQFHQYVERVGGGLFGFVTALIVIGMLTIGFQMLPFGTTILGFCRYSLVDGPTSNPIINPTRDLDRKAKVTLRNTVEWEKARIEPANVWLSPDRFTAGLVSHLSKYALKGRNRYSFGDLHPDFIDSLHYMRDGLYRESLGTVEPDALQVKGCWRLEDDLPLYAYVSDASDNKKVVLEPRKEKPPAGQMLVMVRVTIRESTERAEDRQCLHFTTQQVGLLARERADGPVKAYYLAGISDEFGLGRYIKLWPAQDVQYRRPEGKPQVELDLLFEVPDTTGFTPVALDYKYNACQAVPGIKDAKKNPPPPLGTAPKGGEAQPDEGTPETQGQPPNAPEGNGSTNTEPQPSTSPPPGPVQQPGSSDTPPRRPDRVSGFGPSDKPSFLSDRLPFTLTQYGESNTERGAGVLQGGHINAQLGEDWKPLPGNQPPIASFEVPQGKLMLQLSVEKLQPQSWIGNVFGGAISSISDFYLVDTKGNTYMPVGSWAIAKVGSEVRFELIYLDDIARGMAKLPKFDRIKSAHMKGDYVVYFLFHVPPDIQPRELHTGRRAVDLTGIELVKPK